MNNLYVGSMKYAEIDSDDETGNITVYGDVLGGTIRAKYGMGNVTITGSLIGTAGTGSGTINAGSIGAVYITGSVLGGSGNNSGDIQAGGIIKSITIGGSVEAGAGKSTGSIHSGGNGIGPTTITGDLVGNANDVYSGRISAYATIGNLSIGSMTYGRVEPTPSSLASPSTAMSKVVTLLPKMAWARSRSPGR